MGNLGDKSDYESLRDARISENMARMEMLGQRRRVGELSVIAIASAACRRAGSATPRKTPKPRVLTPLRRSGRLIAVASATPTASSTGPRRSARLNEQSVVRKALPPKGVLSKAAVEEEKAVLVIDKDRVRSCGYCRRGGATARGEGACTTMFLASSAIFLQAEEIVRGRTARAAAKETWTSHA